MKKYKDGKLFDISKEEYEKTKNIFGNHRRARMASSNDYELRIKALEESVATILAKLDEKEVKED